MGNSGAKIANAISVPIQVYHDCSLTNSFKIMVSYQSTTKIEHVLNSATDEIDKKLSPKSCKIKTIARDSFIAPNNKHLHVWSREYAQIISKSVREYAKKKIRTIGLVLCVVFDHKYEHKNDKVTANLPTIFTKHLQNENDDPLHCPMNTASKPHGTNFQGFQQKLERESVCENNDDDFVLSRFQGARIPAARSRNMTEFASTKFTILTEEIQAPQEFAFNTAADQNHPLYKPTSADNKKYLFNVKDGYLNALIEEVVANQFQE
eukprot:775027_1